MTITTVNQEDKHVTGVMWLEYKAGGRSALVPTIVMQSHSSYFIAGMDFWRAFEIKLTWSEEENPSTVVPWNEQYRPDFVPSEKAEVKVVKRKRIRKRNTEVESDPPAKGIGMLSVAAGRSVVTMVRNKQVSATMQSQYETCCAEIVDEPGI